MTDAEKKATAAFVEALVAENMAKRQECPSIMEELMAGLDDDEDDD